MSDPEVPKDGILWRGYDDTVVLLKEKPRPVLAFVLDERALEWPFLREIFAAMPKNQRLRTILNDRCVAMLLKTNEIPEFLRCLGLGDSFFIGILSPSGLTPMVTFASVTGDPESLVNEITRALEAVAQSWIG